MMGYGSSSNLSPLAPPFTVDRSFANPLVDLTEPINSTYSVAMNNPSLHNWVKSTNPSSSGHDYFSAPCPEFESLMSGTQYMYSPSSLSTGNYNNEHHHVPPVNTKALPSTSFVKANAFYPSYLSPPVGEDSTPMVPHHSGYDLLSATRAPVSIGESSVDAYSQSMQHSGHPWGGLWERMAVWQQSNHDAVFCPKDNFVDQGLYSSNYRSKYDGGSHATNAFGSVKHVEAANSGQMDYKSYVDKSLDVVSADYPVGSSVSTSPAPVMFPHASLKAIDSRSPLKWDSCLNDSEQVVKPSPGVVIRMPEAKHPSSVEKLGAGKELNNENFFRNIPSIVKEAYTYTGFGGKVCLDDKDTGFHLKQSEQPASRKRVSGDGLDQLSGAKLGIQVPSINVDAFNTSADDSDVINSVNNSSSSSNLDHHNPAVDSPCWKGAPVSRKSPFEVSDPAPKQDIKRPEACSHSDFQRPQIPPPSASIFLDFSTEKPNEISVQTDDGIMGNTLSFPKKPISREELDAEKPGFSVTCPSYSHRLQIRDDISELNKKYSGKLIDSSDCKISLTEQQNPEQVRCSFGKSCASGNDEADVQINLNDDSDDCSSQVPYDAIENVLCSPPSAENVHDAANRSHGGASAPKTCVRTMLNTMHNLSELLLFSCSNDKSDLREEDYKTLESIINNLDACILKNVEMMTSMPGSFNSHRSNSQPLTSRIHKDVHENSTQAPQVTSISQHILFGKEHNTMSSKEDVCYPARTSAEIGEDKITQSIKSILDQNFRDEEPTHEQALLYKNLWLEAEASLCSINYIARFNRMKMEMEKQKENDRPPNSVLKPNLVSSDTKAGEIPHIAVPVFSSASTRNHADDVLARILGDLTCNVSAYHTSDEVASSSNNGATPNKSLLHSCGQIMNSHVDDVTTNFLNLESYDGKSSSLDSSAAEKLSGFSDLLDPIKVGKTTFTSNKDAKPDIPGQDISVPITASHVDDVIARFHILKNRMANSNSLDNSALEKSSCSKDSSELSNVDKLSNEDKSGMNKNTSIQNFSMGNSVSHADDITARFQALTNRAENLKSADTSVLEILSSSDVPVDPVVADKLDNDAKDGVKQDISVENLVTSGTTSRIDDEEASFIARYQILKQRVDNSGSMYSKRLLPDQCNIGYTGQRLHWDGIWDRTLNMNVDPFLENDASKHGLERSAVAEYLLFSRDDPMAQSESSRSNRIEDQPLAGCYDNGSSDWEHVLKEELTEQNS